MQAPAIFLIAATLLFASMWSSDSTYVDRDAEKLAIKAEMAEAKVAYRNNVPAQLEMIAQTLVTEEISLTEMSSELVADSQVMVPNEIFIPVLNEDDLMFDDRMQEDCRWMARVNVLNRESDYQPHQRAWRDIIAENITIVSQSMLHLSNNMLTTIIEMHQHQQEMQLSASSKKSLKQ